MTDNLPRRSRPRKIFQSRAEHDLRFLSGVEEVETDAEILRIHLASRIDEAFLDKHTAIKLLTGVCLRADCAPNECQKALLCS